MMGEQARAVVVSEVVSGSGGHGRAALHDGWVSTYGENKGLLVVLSSSEVRCVVLGKVYFKAVVVL
jgi:hypothetical protein